ncbi:GntR family transcriptional regulator [Lysinibacillus alkalisoli]|uniref:GntR family transcriptional regulator n=1 Tax=Lysinibacillus alkalisoli TaxID=1911548 RepID=A0A917FZV7_9BACI|nr:PLP-dependent aminotransferase family protein [Lysinibacillus alkalisoli]GGG15878.1 GntR family transcriptional regulator [Lysinibacillus alkalisoli]
MFILDENRPKYQQIYEQIKLGIEQKHWQADDALPSIRALAEDLQVSRNTTLQAYEQLVAEGYIRAVAKRGYFVEPMEPIFMHSETQTIPQKPNVCPPMIDFRLGAVDQQHFPLTKWRQLTQAVLKEPIGYQYGEMLGEQVLREAIVQYVFQARGVKTTASQIVIGSSTQQLLMHLTILLRDEFTSLIVEEPGYSGVKTIFQLQNYQLETIPVTAQGTDIEALFQCKSKICYITPSHQYPYGTALNVAERWRCIQWAHERQGYVIEDDYDGEYRYGQKAFPALASLDPQRVVYMSTFSKAFLPAVRVAYMILPTHLATCYQEKFALLENNASHIHQLALAQFITTGEWERHIKRMRKVYKSKMEALVQALTKAFGDTITIIGKQAGIYIMIAVHLSMDEATLLDRALQMGVKVYPSSDLYITHDELTPHILMGFANVTDEQMFMGVAQLKKAWLHEVKENRV